MAEKVTATKEESNDLATLMPNREIVLAGETITVREYSFKDALTIGNEIDQFVALIVNEMNGTNKITIEQADSIIMNNLELVYSLISTSIQKPISFIEALSYEDGLQLLDWWWVVNSHFFMNAVSRKIIRQNAAKQANQ
ncbi:MULTISPECIES: DUF6631 family protein [unclassified Gilliamella]|uniref:DUF6631 family protein n=1 Tax=unclassified Gilliamella TaxID=2685620 RepID=UPI00130640D4|nr:MULTISPECIES: DUF6631 family protein [unclassified Gilliamella]MWP48816.1 hypothetical protein [Gilliamella sp. Lep-s35]MWP68840.1 hypothetical protein [Gilliamella sp. Lep-s5]MWP77087.1 hypothetical protein [Gilliamella sp. Lep-s21]